MIKHIVIFRLKGSKEERRSLAEQFREALIRLPEIIEPLQSIEVALNLNEKENTDLVLTAIVPTMEDVERYATHPAHVEAASIVKSHVDARLCSDYEF